VAQAFHSFHKGKNMPFSRILTNICSDNLPRSRDFYVELLGFKVGYDSDWYVQLRSPENPELEFGIISRTSELIPKPFQTRPTGMYVTFVVPDVDEVFRVARRMKLQILQEPKNESYGQRRFLTTDPNGCLLDICSPWREGE
jgi:catechol 2,3-dioxygenase-like lactoylglutathione lyase family enzyme